MQGTCQFISGCRPRKCRSHSPFRDHSDTLSAMIYLYFKSSAEEATLGPARAFRVAGNFIRNDATGDILAHYANHFWHVHDKCFTRYECPGKAVFHFEDTEGGKSDRYGP